jgi:hypothetical protein
LKVIGRLTGEAAGHCQGSNMSQRITPVVDLGADQ